MNDRLNASYTSTTVKNAISIQGIEDTAMFKVTVTTSSADLSYEIAHQLETTVPEMMEETNNGLVIATVQDKPIKASAAGSLGYPKKCAIGAIIGLVIAAAYIILRNLIDVRIRSSEELIEKYNIPVLGSIPSFEIKGGQISSQRNTNDDADKKGDEE
jgi:capsular polysaccharide biosynthesis protein